MFLFQKIEETMMWYSDARHAVDRIIRAKNTVLFSRRPNRFPHDIFIDFCPFLCYDNHQITKRRKGYFQEKYLWRKRIKITICGVR